MCEFCHRHGEGEKWYLRAENYSEDLLSDVRRRKFIEGFFSDPGRLRESLANLEKLDRVPPFIRGALIRALSTRQKREHFGQVVPFEDLERILAFVNTIVRLPCICRRITVGREKRYCYGLSISPGGGEFSRIVEGLERSFLAGPDSSGFEVLSRDEALRSLGDHEREGLCHTIWTFRTPFIGGLCNCDRSDCIAMRATVSHGFPVLFRAEYVAAIRPEKCSGCRRCMTVCPFGAIAYSGAEQKSAVDARRCYGCGVCRTSCSGDAVSLLDRAAVPAGAHRW
ncbi:MAG TPA: 4Fe-4S dicluster domain-containing protein [Candidatus Aquicultoraceae bacterium]|nr:4Fe-4S dicluster domain-containing protein [Candidatus Aquicultoraceae bacterium]